MSDWRRRAICFGMDTAEVFYPANPKEITPEAQKASGACPVRESCEEHALTRPEAWGTWGGRSEDALLRERRKQGRRRSGDGERGVA